MYYYDEIKKNNSSPVPVLKIRVIDYKEKIESLNNSPNWRQRCETAPAQTTSTGSFKRIRMFRGTSFPSNSTKSARVSAPKLIFLKFQTLNHHNHIIHDNTYILKKREREASKLIKRNLNATLCLCY